MASANAQGVPLETRRSIRTRVLVLLLGLTTAAVVGMGYLGVSSVQRIGKSARQTSANALRVQAEEYLRQVTKSDVQKNDLILAGIEKDAMKVAQYAAQVFENPDDFADGTYWQAEDHMFVAPDGQYMNGEEDTSSAFVPSFVAIDEEINRMLELGAHLDLVFAPTQDNSPNTVAIYLGTERETTQYYPNISLGSVVPPDFTVTERPWYVSAAPENNPEREVVWSPIYVDATGQGLLVTAAAPVYAGDEFVGVVGVDVTLQDITASVEETRLLGSGYGFLIDDEGRAIALPEQGYEDILGREPQPDEVGADLSGSDTSFAPILAEMMAGSEGFESLSTDEEELFVAYGSLETTRWSLANVVETRSVLQTLASLEADLESSTRSLVLTRALPLGAAILVIVMVVGLLVSRRLTHPIQEMAAAVQRIGAGQWDVPLPRTANDEIGVLAQAFNSMTAQLRGLIAELEQRVADRTSDLQRRAGQLEAAAEVARDAAAIRDVGQLLDATVHLVSERFGFYHAGIFLVDDAREYAVLRAASSQGGQRMLDRGHRLRVGEVGIVGYVAGKGEPRIALDVGQDAVFFDNPDLPQTRSEMAVPLEVRGETVGVLDVQSTEAAAFDQEDVAVLQTMADQVAVAIDNARLLEESQRALRELQLAQGEQVRRAWGRRGQLPAFEYDRVDVRPTDVSPIPVVDRALSSGRIVATDGPDNGKSALAAPLRLRDQAIGAIALEEIDEERSWTQDEMELVQEVSEQVALALESARLFEEARVRAHEQSVLSDLGQALTAQLSIDEILHEAFMKASDLIDTTNFYVGLHDPEREEIVIRFNTTRAEADQQITTLSANEGVSGYVIRTRRPVLIRGNLPQWLSEHGIELVGEPALSWLGVPLAAGEEVLGVMAVQSYSLESRYDEHDLNLLNTVASQTAIALQSARLFEEALETAERLREVDRLKSQFLANMSHELRTPLNSIIGFSRVVLKGIDGPITDRQREDLEAIHNSGQHLLGLINDILDVSKIEAGKMELDFEAVDLQEIINGVMSTAVALVKDKPIELQRSISDALPIITADERRVRQILLNLVSNAAKFTKEGFVRVGARVQGDEVILSVADSGSGIDEAQQERIFEPFTQMDASTTREHGGTGLGLTISHSFVRLHGGRIWVESALGQGSTFYVALPIERPDSEAEDREAPGIGDGPSAAEKLLEEESGELVLCVDDDTGVINLYRRYLNQRGYRVFGLTDSSRVLDMAKRLQPYAITLDVMMPQKDGWDVIQELKAEPATADIPVIICSIVSEAERGMSLGAADYLVKPIMEEDLVAALDRLAQAPGPHQVLVVDDHAGDRELLRRMIESHGGYEVVEAAGGREAISLVKDLRPRIIILDLMMPDVDGFAVLESAKSDETTRSIPIIVVTAKNLTQKDHQRLNHRVDSLVQKGVLKQEELLEDMAAALRRLDGAHALD
jgi:signal transduction histidine kinase/CheY-like chemotaxis protein